MRPGSVSWMARAQYGNSPWSNVPILNWNADNCKLYLNYNWASNRNYNYSVPSLREYSISRPEVIHWMASRFFNVMIFASHQSCVRLYADPIQWRGTVRY